MGRGIHRVILWGGLAALPILIAGVLFYAAYHGYLGDFARHQALLLLAPITPYLPPLETTQRLANIFAAIVTAGGTVAGIVRSLRYAEAALPDRLYEALNRISTGSLGDQRHFLLAVSDDVARRRIPDHEFFDPEFASALKRFRGGSYSKAKPLFKSAEQKLATDEQLISEKLEVVRQQKDSALLIRSAIEIDEYSDCPAQKRDEAAAKISEIIGRLTDLIERGANSLIALQIRGDAYRNLNNVERSREDFEKLAELSRARDNRLMEARALARLAHTYHDQDNHRGRQVACRYFLRAEEVFGNANLLDNEMLRELAEICKDLSVVRVKRTQWPSAEEYAEKALEFARRVEGFDMDQIEKEARSTLDVARFRRGKGEMPERRVRKWWFF